MNNEIQTVERLDGSKILIKDLNKQIQKLVDTANVTGLIVSVFNHDTLAYQRAFGYSNYDQKL